MDGTQINKKEQIMDGEAEEHFKFVDKENEETKEVEDENKKENREEL